ncbi:MAG: hypothetical protein Q7R30_23055 [Acidobacteriota bacterium]|nr:hypothetical protein [Acidobacteriota bacterium]
MESFNQRLQRLVSGTPDEVFFTILNSISNFALPQLVDATRAGFHRLALLGVHSVIQTVGEQIYGLKGDKATTFYLTHFVDGEHPDTKFSAIATDLHTLRNVHAHRWSSRLNHQVGLDASVNQGWWRDEAGLHINPVVFVEHVAAGFAADTAMWRMPRELSELNRLVRKYAFLRQWLELDRGELAQALKRLEASRDLVTALADEKRVRELIAREFEAAA